MAKEENVVVDKLDKNSVLSIKIQLSRKLRIRAWIAIRLIHLAIWVIGCSLDLWVDGEKS